MKKISTILFLLLVFQLTYSHPWKPSHYVIIDTDAGIDDMRAISMILASDDIRVLGIIVSGGALSPYDGYKKVKSMLNKYHHNGIPVAMNYNIRGHDMEIPLSVKWGAEEGLEVPETNGFNKLCRNLLEHEKADVSFVMLGSLNTTAELLRNEVIDAGRIKEIIWSNNSSNETGGFNGSIDTRSARWITKAEVPLVMVTYPGSKDFYSTGLLGEMGKINTRYARKLNSLFTDNPDLNKHDFALGLADEMVALYLHDPGLFREKDSRHMKIVSPVEVGIEAAVFEMLGGGLYKGRQVMKNIPSDTSFYQPDLQPFISDIINMHGEDEWEACIITSEMHRHLGIFSIIGAKMGMLAREYFDVGVDEMTILSMAGNIPPLSCMNDGLQVSTGATTGHGLLKINASEPSASAEFTHMGQCIRIALKEDLARKLSDELAELNMVNGLDSDIYWELVRQRAIQYWKSLSRYDIFEIHPVDDGLQLAEFK